MAGKTFTDTNQAFQYFIEEIYPTLPSDKTQKIKQYVYFFKTRKQGVSESKMHEILMKYGDVEIEKTIRLIFK